ncbi:hypothetical protein RhiXN_02313 [Rhizoctonia solani]|uniref:Uncharacterized protein n=1 Tax=Rhizoctonia solani TaxID=456999 RepID=A0A8H8T4T7_9AGAM|nr:uncharacterized protein RhiXN_02313 [Rhizoctonia solani]QRW27718.1 hypothetical protein RhiXN_02313 [Rhizoctonia solani]
MQHAQYTLACLISPKLPIGPSTGEQIPSHEHPGRNKQHASNATARNGPIERVAPSRVPTDRTPRPDHREDKSSPPRERAQDVKSQCPPKPYALKDGPFRVRRM